TAHPPPPPRRDGEGARPPGHPEAPLIPVRACLDIGDGRREVVVASHRRRHAGLSQWSLTRRHLRRTAGHRQSPCRVLWSWPSLRRRHPCVTGSRPAAAYPLTLTLPRRPPIVDFTSSAAA